MKWVVVAMGGIRREVAMVVVAMLILLSMPFVAVVVVASSGVAIVSDAFAALNPVTHLVEIFNPDGEKVAELEVSTVWPAEGYVSDEFGTHGEFRHQLGLGAHNGIDIANSNGLTGDPITPFMTGTVLYHDNIDDSACGKHIKLDHGNHITSVYCHLDHAQELPEGTEVNPGNLIGSMGSTGTSTGPHLHFGVSVYGIPVNPRTFMIGEPKMLLVEF